jgi:DNA ligase-1
MNNFTDLQSIQNFINESNKTNSNTDKLNVLKLYTENITVKKALQYTYDTFKQYGVTSENCKKNSQLVKYGYTNLFVLLDDLNNRWITGHTAISSVNGFVQANKSYEDLIFSIIDRNLKTRSTTSMINKVMPGLIPTFDVALANSYDEKMAKKIDLNNDTWYLSRKLDGCRCICIIDDNGEPKYFSRAGNEFTTLRNLDSQIISLELKNVVIDGEICMMDENGNENFQGIIKEIKKKDHSIRNPFFYMFDIIPTDDFINKKGNTLFGIRNVQLENLFFLKKFKNIGVLEQKIVVDDKMLNHYIGYAKEQGWEGLMLRRDADYIGKRSNDVLKVKQFCDAEYTVIDIENAFNRVIVDGVEIEEMMMKNVVIEHKGNRVQVGSGFNHEQKRFFFQNPNEILGKQITVQYFEETLNEKGSYSLRFPTFKGLYETKRNF